MQKNMTDMQCGLITEYMQENMQCMKNMLTMPKICKVYTPHLADDVLAFKFRVTGSETDAGTAPSARAAAAAAPQAPEGPGLVFKTFTTSDRDKLTFNLTGTTCLSTSAKWGVHIHAIKCCTCAHAYCCIFLHISCIFFCT
jgi:hypothetical protein